MRLMTTGTGDRRSARLPILQGVLPVRRSQIPAEIVAGVTVAALAIPEVIGYTKISGTPIITGLYTMMLPMALFAIFGSSRHLVVGADSATAAILAAGLVGLAATGTDEYTALAALLAIMAAGFLFFARFAGLGFFADFLSRSVLIGFLTGVGAQVSLGQISGMLGLKGGGHGTLQKIWTDLQQIGQINYAALGVALSVLAIILGAKAISKRIPGPLIAVVGAIAVSWAFDFERYMHVLGPVPGGIPKFGLPEVDWSWALIQKLMPTALAMFVVILAQSAATSRAYAARYGEAFSENTDLVGLGMANVGAGVSGAFVVAGSPTKTQMLDSAGGRSQLSLLVTASVVLLVLLFLTDVLAFMPEPVLAAIVFVIGLGLIDVRGMKRVFDQRRSEFWIAAITMATVVVVGVEQGILLAIVLSLIDHTRRGYRPKNAVLVPGESGALLSQPVATRGEAAPGLVIYRFNHSLYYANAKRLTDEIMDLAENASPPARWICLDASAIDDVDFSAAEALCALHDLLEQKGVRLVFANVEDILATDSDDSLRRLFGEDAFFGSLDEMMTAWRKALASAPG